MDVGLEFIHLADPSRPHSPASFDVATANQEGPIEGTQVISDGVEGLAVLTQICDIVRFSEERQFIEVAIN